MAKIVSNKRVAMFEDEFDVDDLGAETEAEKQMRVILDKQLNTNMSLKEQFSQHRTFISPSTFTSLTELVHGTCSLEKFKEIEKDEEVRQELQRCGLSNDEIMQYMKYKSKKVEKISMVNPDIEKEIIQKLEEKIKAHNEDLLKPQEFNNVKKLTRHEMEIEKSLYTGCSDKNKLSLLVSAQSNSDDDRSFMHIKTLSCQWRNKMTKKSVKDKYHAVARNKPSKDFFKSEKIHFDPNIHYVSVALSDDEVCNNRLSINDIKNMPRFQNYTAGKPNKTLFLKNLHSKATVQELRSIFGKFEKENGCPIYYKWCSGKMKGQAFITFSNSTLSEKALNFVNGYILRKKPIIIEFGKNH